MTRLHFTDLPDAVRLAIERQAGEIKTARSVANGTNSGVAALLVTEAGAVFVKGIAADHPQAMSLERALVVASYLPSSSPRLLWHVTAGGWIVLGYEAVDGRHPDFTDSGDLVLVLDALSELQEVQLPASIGLPLADVRWAGYADEGQAHLFRGNTLLHTDLVPGNILLGERAHFVDWAWPTKGAAFIDPYLLALRLVQAGFRPGDAITWVRRLPSWREAPTQGLEAFAVAVTRMWRDIAHQDPVDWKLTVAGKAAELRTYLLTTPWARNCG